MRSFAVPALVAVAVAAVAATAASPPVPGLKPRPEARPDVNMGVGRHWNAGWSDSRRRADRDTAEMWSHAAAEKPLSAAQAAASYIDTDPVSSNSMGLGGPMRIELPLDLTTVSAAGDGNRLQSAEQLIASKRGEQVVLTHQEFPQLSVRIKQVGRPTAIRSTVAQTDPADPEAFCDPTVTSWSGYIDTIDGKSLFFYFFESRSNPKEDPVILWTNGGPGCSSSLGLFQEHGPCRIPERGGARQDGPPINGTEWFPQSWNNRANVIYIDQPVGVGFSYSRYGVHSYNTEDAAKDVYRFLRIFFSAFDRFRDNDFHLAGESYGGRYVPVFASEVVDRNAEVRRAARKKGAEPKGEELINLKSIIVGNGLTDISRQMGSYYDYTCTRKGGVEPIVSIETCKRMSTWVPRCERWLADHCTQTYAADLCRAAVDTCSTELQGPFMATGQNPYNILDDCKAGLSPNLCYNVMEDIRNYLDRDDVRELVGAAPVEEIGRFQTCSNEVAYGFDESNDGALDNGLNVAGLLERGVRALIYVGDLDWICNWLGNKKWVTALEWYGGESWTKAKNYHWIVDGKKAGETQSAKGLTWATVNGAGHMVPYDQPDRALALLNRWLDGEDL